jgi:hypothetical protein
MGIFMVNQDLKALNNLVIIFKNQLCFLTVDLG